MNKEIQEIVRDARHKGWHVSLTRKGYAVENPDRGGPIYFHGTPSDNRAIKNLMADLRRKGWDEDGRAVKSEIPLDVAQYISDLSESLEEAEEAFIDSTDTLTELGVVFEQTKKDTRAAGDARAGAVAKMETRRARCEKLEHEEKILRDGLSKMKLENGGLETELRAVTAANASPPPMSIGDRIRTASEMLSKLSHYSGSTGEQVVAEDIATVIEFMEEVQAC